MASWKTKLALVGRLIAQVPLVLVIVVVFLVGYQLSTAVHRSGGTAPDGNAGEQNPANSTQIWTCSMHPQIKLPEPGSCPICGMDLVLSKPVPAVSAAPKEQALYACSMFCLPPQPNPGKCQICGMEMVEVELGDAAGGGSATARSLTLSPTAQKLAEIMTEPVSRQFVAAEIGMVGKVDFDETRLGHITAWVPGRLERLYVDYTGIPVNEGDHMVYLYSPELSAAQTELLQALERARATGDSEGALVNQRALDWLEDIRDKFRLWGLTDEQIKEIETRGAPTDYMTIYAPMGGIVIHKNVVEGMYVNTGTRIYTIADLSRVWVKLDAYESDLQWLRYGQEIEFETEAYPGDVFAGRIAFIDPVLDAKTRTVNVRVNVANEDGRLKPEMFVRAVVHAKVADGGRIVDAELAGKWISPMHPEIVKDEPGTCDVCGMPLVRAESLGFVSVETGDAIPPLVVPASAPLKTGKRALVYTAVAESPGKYEGREVVLGPRAGDHYIVRDGLSEDELVVVHGNFKIDSAMQIMARPSMMSAADGESVPDHERHGELAEDQSAVATSLPNPRSEVNQAVQSLDVPPSFRIQLDPIYAEYVKVQTALSKDDLAAAKRATESLRAALSEPDMSLLSGGAHDHWMKDERELTATAARLSKAATIEEARFSFALLSESMIAVAKRFGSAALTLHRIHCPMAFDDRGADWLQTSERTQNPFFGSAMYRCGSLEESIASPTETPADGGADGG